MARLDERLPGILIDDFPASNGDQDNLQVALIAQEPVSASGIAEGLAWRHASVTLYNIGNADEQGVAALTTHLAEMRPNVVITDTRKELAQTVLRALREEGLLCVRIGIRPPDPEDYGIEFVPKPVFPSELAQLVHSQTNHTNQ